MFNKVKTILELPTRVFGPSSRYESTNEEGIESFNITRPKIHRRHGVSAMLRAKNEEDCIAENLLSIVDVFPEIIFVDNGSTDDTLNIVKDIAKKHRNIKTFSYPYILSRCGSEHQHTNANSLKSLTYYYNWCLSKCTYSYVMKWDADMRLTHNSKPKFKEVLSALNPYWPTFSEVELQTVYAHCDNYYLSKDEVNFEVMIFPNRADVHYIKAENFELLSGKKYSVRRITTESVQIYEMKNTSKNEFSHWDTLDFPTKRKKLEYERFIELKNNNLNNFKLLKGF
ncbi:MAG: glycosyltransferase [Thalassotalea sp.]|nr:glycosyltransferase [Thalassotalea sp.]